MVNMTNNTTTAMAANSVDKAGELAMASNSLLTAVMWLLILLTLAGGPHAHWLTEWPNWCVHWLIE
jgi:hypothetical protein